MTTALNSPGIIAIVLQGILFVWTMVLAGIAFARATPVTWERSFVHASLIVVTLLSIGSMVLTSYAGPGDMQ